MEQGTQVKRSSGTVRNSGCPAAGRTSRTRKLAEQPGRLLERSFCEAPPERVGPRILGKLLVLRTKAGPVIGRIVEVEAYQGPHNSPPDPAAHSFRGPTPRNLVLFGPAAHAYVYAIYGRYFCMNVSCETDGQAGCLLLRALEPVGAFSAKQMAINRGLDPHSDPRLLASGPSRLCMALGLTRPVHNGIDLVDPASPLQLRDDGFTLREVIATPRIGISHAVEWPLRYIIPDNPSVSGPKRMSKGFSGNRIFLD